MVEYGIVVVLIAVIIIGLVQAMGLSVRGMFEAVADAFT
jgi:Flp pilus assembly pilin Flp